MSSSDDDSDDETSFTAVCKKQRGVLRRLLLETNSLLHSVQRIQVLLADQAAVEQQIQRWGQEGCLGSKGTMVLLHGQWVSVYDAIRFLLLK